MTVHFIGAGPGAPDLITVRGQRLISQCPVCLYAGSLVPREVVACAPPGARVLDTAGMTLDEMVAEMKAAFDAGRDVARVHTGDPSLYGAIAEQMRRLDALGIPYDVTPGVPAYCGAAAALKHELTLPGIRQTIILTRTTNIAAKVRLAAISRTALILVGRVLDAAQFPDSLLYDPAFSHGTRKLSGGLPEGSGEELQVFK